MRSDDLASTPVVSSLSVTIDVEDTIQSDNNLVSGTGTYTVVFTKPFYSASYAVGLTNQSMATGDFYTLNNKTINGFDIAFKNSSSAGVSRTFDYICKGF